MAVCKSYKIREIPALKIHGRTAGETGPLTISGPAGLSSVWKIIRNRPATGRSK